MSSTRPAKRTPTTQWLSSLPGSRATFMDSGRPSRASGSRGSRSTVSRPRTGSTTCSRGSNNNRTTSERWVMSNLLSFSCAKIISRLSITRRSSYLHEEVEVVEEGEEDSLLEVQEVAEEEVAEDSLQEVAE